MLVERNHPLHALITDLANSPCNLFLKQSAIYSAKSKSSKKPNSCNFLSLYTEILYPTDFQKYVFRIPSNDELINIMNMYSSGIPLGIVTYDKYEDQLPQPILPYFFPFDKAEIGYKGIFVVGSPGKGKTNFFTWFSTLYV